MTSAIFLAPAKIIGIVFGSFIIGVSRNPDLSDDLFKICIMDFALFSLMIAFLCYLDYNINV